MNNAAVRHAVYNLMLCYLPAASREQTLRIMANLRLRSGLGRFLDLKVSPGCGETSYRGATLAEIERVFNRRYGELLADVPGFYRRVSDQRSAIGDQQNGSWRLNLPRNCALYAYRRGGLYAGIMCIPFDSLNRFFLLSSAKYDGPRAARLSPKDHVYFTQFEEAA